ncbi:MAG: hypothetical protein WDK96_01530 [Candidatus Paceibacterota bacterium]|jgi:hypothetical protein
MDTIQNSLNEFSEEELKDMDYLIWAINSFCNREEGEINHLAFALLQSDMLATVGITEKVRVFSSRVHKKLKKFSSLAQ